METKEVSNGTVGATYCPFSIKGVIAFSFHSYVSNIPLTFAEDNERLIKRVEAFKAGVWRGIKYTVSDLQAMANNFRALKEDGLLDPPLKIDHSESARDVVGWVQDLYVDGDSLFADVLVTEDEALDKVKRGTWKKVSSEIYSNYAEESNGKKYGKVFRALSIVAIPHLKNIKGIVLNAEEVIEEVTLEQIRALLDEKLGGLEKDKVDFSEVSNGILDQVKGEIQKYQEKADQAMKHAETMAKAVKANQIEKEVKAYSEAGKIVPAQEEPLTKLLGTFSEEQKELFKQFMENKVDVEVGTEHTEFSESKLDEDLSPEELAKKYLG